MNIFNKQQQISMSLMTKSPTASPFPSLSDGMSDRGVLKLQFHPINLSVISVPVYLPCYYSII